VSSPKFWSKRPLNATVWEPLRRINWNSIHLLETLGTHRPSRIAAEQGLRLTATLLAAMNLVYEFAVFVFISVANSNSNWYITVPLARPIHQTSQAYIRIITTLCNVFFRQFMHLSTLYNFCSSTRKRILSPVRLVLEDSSKRSFMLFAVVSLQLGSII